MQTLAELIGSTKVSQFLSQVLMPKVTLPRNVQGLSAKFSLHLTQDPLARHTSHVDELLHATLERNNNVITKPSEVTITTEP